MAKDDASSTRIPDVFQLTPTQTTVTAERRRPLRDEEIIEQILGKMEYLSLQKNREGSQNLPDPFHKW